VSVRRKASFVYFHLFLYTQCCTQAMSSGKGKERGGKKKKGKKRGKNEEEKEMGRRFLVHKGCSLFDRMISGADHRTRREKRKRREGERGGRKDLDESRLEILNRLCTNLCDSRILTPKREGGKRGERGGKKRREGGGVEREE